MLEWIAVVIAGAGGGAGSTLLPSGTDFPWPDVLQKELNEKPAIIFVAHLTRNILLGALASFLIWGLATDADFSTANVTVREVALAIIVGGGGPSIVNNLFSQARRIEAFSKTIDNLQEVLEQIKKEKENA